MKNIGDIAPDFTLLSNNNEMTSLPKDKTTVLYFYPKDNTPGCTLEAKGFRDYYKEFLDKNITILGISTDNNNSHKKFSEKYALPFPILSDENGIVCKEYGTLKNKGIYKLKNMTKRVTFLIDKNHKILYVWDKIKIDKHPQDILKKIDEIKP
ncbi:peroxiredoxin [Patescibacteria group bacterium]|nr:peroxiredoxin [Patescibacteria group bacterium]